MKSKVVAISLLASSSMLGLGYSSMLYGEICYEVTGTTTTQFVTASTQVGDIDLQLSLGDTVVFDETGSLVGNIIDTIGETNILSHVAKFSKGNQFVTSNDLAYPDLDCPGDACPVRLYDEYGNLLLDESGNPCSVWIKEEISEIVGGTRLFKNVIDLDIYANGYITYCPNVKENKFTLSGIVCVE